MRTGTGSTSRCIACFFAVIISAFAMLTTIGTVPAQAGKKYAGIVIDAKTGRVLYSHKADSPRYPASLTKMMTLYMVFDQMERGKMSKKTRIRISRHAASMQPSKLGIRVGGSLSAEQAIYSLVTKSANDVAAAVGEHIGGTESNFAKMMTAKARSIGMKSTTFKNASGLPNSRQVTTARDMARLGIALREHFPKQYRYFSTRSFKYGKKRMGNHNKLLGRVKGVDGIKTGYTRASGFNLVSSVQHRKRSIVGVVLGGKSGRSRNAQMTSLIKKYLPKASTGRDRTLVAKKGGSSVFASIFKPKKAPVPEKRPVMVSAYAPQEVETPASESLVSRTEEVLGSIPASQVPVPTPNPVGITDPVNTAVINRSPAPVRPMADIASAPSSSASPSPTSEPAPGWQIQIGAVPTLESAIDRLASARKIAPKSLGRVDDYTMEIDKNGTTLYRARFAGFASKDDAWAACKVLKKKFGCLALAN